VRTARDEDLQWSNPEIAYDREDVDISEEYQISLSKSFDMPWSYLKKRSSWKSRLQSAELMGKQRTNDFLADARRGYVELKLLDEYLSRLQQLKEIVVEVSQAATTRLTEGYLSGVEEHLIQMTAVSLRASYQAVLQERREVADQWRAEMGIQPGDSIFLETRVDYQPLQLQSVAEYLNLIEQQPGYRSRLKLQESLDKRAAAEQGKFISSIDIYGGFKRIEPGLDGYVAGLALSVPIFNKNGVVAKRYDIEKNIVEYETYLYRTKLTHRLDTLIESMKDSQQLLDIAADYLHQDNKVLNNLVYSYEEGWQDLGDLLNAIQIEDSGLKDFYYQLIKYYENLFELEAILGTQLVVFEE
jgi:hypothetical protein